MYIRNLLYRAKAQRSPVWLTAALLAQNPTWNSQAAAIALALMPILELANWDYDLVEDVFFSSILPTVPEELRQVKFTALHALASARDCPRDITFGSTLAGKLAYAAILHRELPDLLIEDGKARLPGYYADLDLEESPLLSLEEYLMGVPPEVRHFHPDFLVSKAEALVQRFMAGFPEPTPIGGADFQLTHVTA
ncbi:hypothetical protein G20c_33 [Thermus phage G20c]|nr:hypothetical protein G20c_33 [Thermus phage G20c]